MKIIYGVSGEGLGHVFEAIEIIAALKREGHTVKVITYGDRAYSFLNSFKPIRIEGVELHTTSKGFSIWLTFFRNLHIIGFYIRNWSRLKKEIIDFKPDVFITAFELYTTIISHVLHKPLISIDNQNDLLYVKKPKGVSIFDFKIVQCSTRVCTWGASYYIVKSFYKRAVSHKNVHFVYPTVQRETRKFEMMTGDHIFVYLTKTNENLIALIKKLPYLFIVYCQGKNGVDGNITYRASGGPGYLEDLRTCRAIIATTGFSLISDAFFLKKPYFGVPLKNQFEQVYNAHLLKQFNIGEFSENVTQEELNAFFNNLSVYRTSLEKYHFDPDDEERTLKEILLKIKQNK
ncbi:MAG: glycosyltransferase family protein [bacterium]